MIPIYQPSITNKEKEYVSDCLSTGWISSRGSYINKFETACSDYLNSKYVSTCSNGTASLMLIIASLIKIGLVPNETHFIAPTLTYSASISQPIWMGHKGFLFDCDERGQPSFDSFVNIYTKAKFYDLKISYLILPELYGSSPDIELFMDFCNKENILVIEDSAEVFGSEFNNKKLGTFGIAGSYSFFGNKTITTGEGGLITTNNASLFDAINLLKSQSHIGNFDHDGPGFNFRMTNIQAAIGLAQLENISNIVSRKQFIANFYRRYLPFNIIPNHKKINYSSEWMPLISSEFDYIDIKSHFDKYEIDTRPCFKPIHLMNGWKPNVIYSVDDLNQATTFYKNSFNLPSYPELTHVELSFIVNAANNMVKI